MTLYLVATPIGNLKDITLRALEILKSTPVLLVESYEDSRPLLAAYDIHPQRIIKYNDRNSRKMVPEILNILKEKNVVLITSAGMPGVSDPAADLVSACYAAGIEIIPIPGSSALTTAIAASGFRGDFLFIGFLPKKRGQIEKILREAKENGHVLVFFESTYRLQKTLTLINEAYPTARLFLGKEMTKKFERYVRGSSEAMMRHLESDKKFSKGEFTIAISFDQ